MLMLMTATAMCGSLCICFPAVVLLLPWVPGAYHTVVSLVARHWLRFAALLVEKLGRVNFIFSGDFCGTNESRVLVICNHRTRLDWMFLWSLFARLGMLRSLKIMLKAELKFAPFFGWSMQCFLFIFLSRSTNSWEDDKSYLQQVLTYVCKQPGSPVTILLFPEGTDLSDSNIAKSHRWSKKNDLKKKKFTLHPRVKGFAHTVQVVRTSIDTVLDVTLGYVDRGGRPNEKSLLFSTLPKEIHCHCKLYPMTELPTDEIGLAKWLTERFDEKEAILEAFYATPSGERRLGTMQHAFCNMTCPFIVSSLFWCLVLLLVSYLALYHFTPFALYILGASAFFYGVSRCLGGVDKVELRVYSPDRKPKAD